MNYLPQQMEKLEKDFFTNASRWKCAFHNFVTSQLGDAPMACPWPEHRNNEELRTVEGLASVVQSAAHGEFAPATMRVYERKEMRVVTDLGHGMAAVSSLWTWKLKSVETPFPASLYVDDPGTNPWKAPIAENA